MIKLFEDFLNEYNVANSGIITMYNLDDNIIMRLEVLGASVKEESRKGKDVTYEVSFPSKEIGDDILNLLQEVDPLPMPDMVHLYPGLFENKQNIYNMKGFDDFEKTIRINESEVSFIGEGGQKTVFKPTLDKEHEKILFPNRADAKKAIEDLIKAGIKKEYIILSGQFEDTLKFINSAAFKEAYTKLKITESEILIESTEAMQLVKKFEAPTYPKKPFKRDLTNEENEAMHMHFPMYSWSNIDADGKIILGGGEESRGKFYITEDDLKKVLALPKVKEIKK